MLRTRRLFHIFFVFFMLFFRCSVPPCPLPVYLCIPSRGGADSSRAFAYISNREPSVFCLNSVARCRLTTVPSRPCSQTDCGNRRWEGRGRPEGERCTANRGFEEIWVKITELSRWAGLSFAFKRPCAMDAETFCLRLAINAGREGATINLRSADM